jgi:hypothetical protein
MTFAILLAAAATQGEPAPPPPVPFDFRLKAGERSTRITPDSCRRDAAAGEIVVCGRPDEYRVEDLEMRPEWAAKGIPKVGMTLAPGVTLEPTMEQVALQQGLISKRFMATVKFKF